MSEQVLRRDEWESSTPRGSLLPRLQETILKLGGSIRSKDEQSIEATFGSSIQYRLFGAYLPGASRRAPLGLRLTVEARDGSRSSLGVTLQDASGWYAFRVPAHARTLERRSEEIVSALRAAG